MQNFLPITRFAFENFNIHTTIVAILIRQLFVVNRLKIRHSLCSNDPLASMILFINRAKEVHQFNMCNSCFQIANIRQQPTVSDVCQHMKNVCEKLPEKPSLSAFKSFRKVSLEIIISGYAGIWYGYMLYEQQMQNYVGVCKMYYSPCEKHSLLSNFMIFVKPPHTALMFTRLNDGC